MIQRLLISLLGPLILCAGCASVNWQDGSAGLRRSLRPESNTLARLDEELEAELRDVATDFTMQIPDSRYAWERAQLFFKEHTTKGHFSAGRADAVILTNSGSQDVVVYTVTKSTASSGTRFSLACVSGAQRLSADTLAIQCKNLARFIHLGVLEQSLILR